MRPVKELLASGLSIVVQAISILVEIVLSTEWCALAQAHELYLTRVKLQILTNPVQPSLLVQLLY